MLLLCSTLAACAETPPDQVVPPPPLPFLPQSIALPDDATLRSQIASALETRHASTYDTNFDAVDPGEGIEHATFSQLFIDASEPSLAKLFVRGDELFEYAFRVEDGLGNALAKRPGVRAGNQPPPNMRRVHKSDFGGPDSYSCASCHSKGGPDGAGANTQNAFLRGNGKDALRADERNPPHLLGLGPIQALAREMSQELFQQRDSAIVTAMASHRAQLVELETKSISFGSITVAPDGTVDFSQVVGIDPDLILRPFGWKGHSASLRAMAEESFRIHMGLLSTREQLAFKEGGRPKENYGDGPWFDVDQDNRHLEIDSGMLTTMVVYLAQLEVPQILPPTPPALRKRYEQGKVFFDSMGCAGCHKPTIVLKNPVLQVVPADPRYQDRPAIEVNVAIDGNAPKIGASQTEQASYSVQLFSDLKRHDMGPRLHSGWRQGTIPKSVFLTRPLWGLAETGPYLHDGRAPTVHDAILWHGGEAEAATLAYKSASTDDQKSLVIFLLSLSREAKLLAH